MLTPSNKNIVLLPQDKEIIYTLGITEVQYRAFVREGLRRSRVEPGKPQNFLLIPFFIQLVIGVALSYAASLLLPKGSNGKTANIRQTQKGGQNIVGQSEFAPKAGFDSTQSVVELGSTIPIIYSRRETLDGITYGGVRINASLLWSQMQSFGGNQMLRAIFLISEGAIGNIDYTQFAFGDNTLNAYDLGTANADSSRITFYFRPNGGRIQSTNRIAGRSANNDPGNAQNYGAPDVFHVRGMNNAWTSNFCYSYKPSTQTQFGVYSLIGAGFGYRVNPSMRPAVALKTEPARKNSQDIRIRCNSDGVAQAQRDKYNYIFTSYSGFVSLNGSSLTFNLNPVQLNTGDILVYRLNRKSDAKKIFKGKQPGEDHKETCNDVAQTISGRQRTWDDALTIGDLYRCGSAHLICISRSPTDEIFASEVDQEPVGGGQSIDVTFRVVRTGVARVLAENQAFNATRAAHIYKLAIATFSLPRAAQVIEIGIRSVLGIRFNGICNFRDAISHTEIDGRACRFYEGRRYGPKEDLELGTFQSGTYSGTEMRYSFFRIRFRKAGSTEAYKTLNQCFGVRGITQQNSFNYIRLQMPQFAVWEFSLEPLSGYEIRSGIASGDLEILDSRSSEFRTVSSDGCLISFNGQPVDRNEDTFQMAATKSKNLGIELMDDEDHADEWGRLAEAFVYEEIQSSARSPEHEIAYINILTPNPSVPTYPNMAILGMNIRSSTEFNQLKQLSVYVTNGVNNLNTFPGILQDLLLNKRYGVGSTLSAEQLDYPSFTSTIAWTQERRYFWNGALNEPFNIRQWASQTASFFLLDFVIRSGKFSLQPAVYFDRPEPITNLFTSGNIIEDTFEFAYAEAEQRIPKRVSIKWRHERPVNTNSTNGLFPLIREISIREAGTPEDAPLESIDLSDFCTSQEHAIDVGKYLCRTSRLITHSVKFKTPPTQGGLDIGRCFKLGMETILYSQPNNGVIDGEGNVSSTDPLANGSHTVLLWDGVVNQIQEVTLNVQDGKTTQFKSAVFCKKVTSLDTQAYKVQSLSFDEDGNLDVEASIFPLMSNGYSEIVAGWDNDTNWIIEGQIGGSQNDDDIIEPFTGLSIRGSTSLTVGQPRQYTALINGGDGVYTYLWSGTDFTFSAPTSKTTNVTASGSSRTTTISCTVTRGSTSFTKAYEVEVVDNISNLITIGTPTISGPSEVSLGRSYNYTVSYPSKPQVISASAIQPNEFYQIVTTGTTNFTAIGATNNNAYTTFLATAAGSGTGTVAPMNHLFTSWDCEGDNEDTEDALISNSSAPTSTISLLKPGIYTITCTLSSINATDSPKTATFVVTAVEPTVFISAQDPNAAETGSGVTPNPGLFFVMRSGPPQRPLVVNLSVSGTATPGDDYVAIPTTVTFPENSASINVPVSVIADLIPELPESVIVTVEPGPLYKVGTANSATVTITDPTVPSVSVTASIASATEGNQAEFAFTRTGASTSELIVGLIVSGTAVPDTDYTALPLTVTIPANVTTVTLPVVTLDDNSIEVDETIIVTVAPGTNYLVGTPSTATVTIKDDEFSTIINTILPVVNVVASTSSASEGNSGQFTFSRTGSTLNSLPVYFTTSGTAISGTDYTALPPSVTIPSGSTTTTLNVAALEDAIVELNETVTVSITPNSIYAIGSPDNATVTFIDSTVIPYSVSVISLSLSAGVVGVTHNSTSAGFAENSPSFGFILPDIALSTSATSTGNTHGTNIQTWNEPSPGISVSVPYISLGV